MARETAVERRAREAQEAREAQAEFKRELPMILLGLLARANSLDVRTQVSESNPAGVLVTFIWDNLPASYTNTSGIFVGGLQPSEPWELNEVRNMLDDIEARKREEERMRQVREHALNKLTTEEREALGL